MRQEDKSSVRQKTFKARGLETRGVRILAMDLDRELDFQLFGDSGCGFWSNKKRNRNTYTG